MHARAQGKEAPKGRELGASLLVAQDLVLLNIFPHTVKAGMGIRIYPRMRLESITKHNKHNKQKVQEARTPEQKVTSTAQCRSPSGTLAESLGR